MYGELDENWSYEDQFEHDGSVEWDIELPEVDIKENKTNEEIPF